MTGRDSDVIMSLRIFSHIAKLGLMNSRKVNAGLICSLGLLYALHRCAYRKGKHLSAVVTSAQPHMDTFVDQYIVQQCRSGTGSLCSDRWHSVMCSATCPFPQQTHTHTHVRACTCAHTHTHAHLSHPPGSSTLLFRSRQEIININISAVYRLFPHFSLSALDNLRAGTAHVCKYVLAQKPKSMI